jgi:hypothetical protein
LKSPDLFRALAGLIKEPHLTAAFRLDCKYVTLAATLSHPLPYQHAKVSEVVLVENTEAGWWRRQSHSNQSLCANSLLTGKRTGNFQELPDLLSKKRQMAASPRASGCKFPTNKTGNYFRGTEKLSPGTGISMHPLAEVRFSPESGRVRRKPSGLLWA